MTWNGESALSVQRRKRSLRAALAAAWLATALSGCLVGDDKCGANQVEVKGDTPGCACAEGSVPGADGHTCVKCGEHEEAVATMCECASGFARPAAEMPCEAVTGSVIGAECSADEPCSEPYPYCATLSGQSFCTSQNCKANADCPPDYGCHSEGADKFCAKAAGLGKSCQASADCAGGEATFCESFVTKTCIVEKCAANTNICPSGNVCCDLSGLIGTSVCTPSRVLMNGMCADGKAPVSP